MAEGAISIEERLRSFIGENFTYSTDSRELTNDIRLFERGIIDSTGVLELVAFLEESFELSVDDEELLPENFDTIANLAAFVRRKLS